MRRFAALRAAGTGFVVDLAAQPLPVVVHWGRDLGQLDASGLAALAFVGEPAVLNNSVDVPRRCSVWPTEAEGWAGTPALSGHRDGVATTPRPRLVEHELIDNRLELVLDDAVTGLRITLVYEMDDSGVLSVRATLVASEHYEVTNVSTLMPVPSRAVEVLDFTGKWCRERSPQRTRLGHGAHVRESRRGKPGQDTAYLMTVGVPGFGFAEGEVWALHVAWSGDQRYVVEQLPETPPVLGGGELLRAGEIRLSPGERYETPTCYHAWSDEGLDGLAARFHALQRKEVRPPRPLVLNTWEAVYFDHDLDRLRALADAAAKVGVERVVLDDGWFRGRRDDTAGLGDWQVDAAVWPQGLTPFVAHVKGLGMQFGLWVEPEMVNLDSNLAREHPEWILGVPGDPGPPSRNQYVVDLDNPDAWAYLLTSIDDLVSRYGIDYLKWDHNRDLHEAVTFDGRPSVHNQTLALYRLIDELKRRHPGLEIESCASGGGRVDLGILARTDRVWASDCNDPVERQSIQRWTAQLLPPELIGSHVGPERSHTTSRRTDASFRLATALFGHAGIEQDLTACSAAEIDALTAWASMYKELRSLLHSGRVVRADLPDEAGLFFHGVISNGHGLFCLARISTSAAGQSWRVRLPGLSRGRDYRLRIRADLGLPSMRQVRAPEWVSAALAGWVRVPGAVLVDAGVAMPTLDPGQALLLEVIVDRA
jgi:alpha-galactosidase